MLRTTRNIRILNNKGISPLISTVLLIGFAIALAAVVMTWGLDFIKGITEDTEEKTEDALICANQLNFEITEVSCDGYVKVDNRGNIDIEKLTFRVHKGDDVTAETRDEGEDPILPSLALTRFDGFNFDQATQIDVVATLQTSKGKDVLCSSSIEEFEINPPCGS